MMDDRRKVDGAGGPWAPYVPDEKSPWNLRRVVHLHRRAGFGATWDELQRDLRDGPEPSIGRFLGGKAHSSGVSDDFEHIARLMAGADIKAWWLYRMLCGPDPLTERLVLMWHNHFATSIEKVGVRAPMRHQNETCRSLARAPFGRLLEAMARDPALLIWLDAPTNRKGRPNENLAREMMELFSLGVGHYSEGDVKEASRALTGWTVWNGAFAEHLDEHDDGEKTILGRRGRWRGSDLVAMLREHPATSVRLAWRIAVHFLGEGAVDRASLAALAEGLRRHDLDVGWAVATILRSRAFFADNALETRVLGPVEFVVGSARALELFRPPPSTLLLADWSARLGQDLFAPPNVGGWPEGRAWLTHQGLVGRANYAAALVGGRLFDRRAPVDILALAERHGFGGADAAAGFAASLLLGTPTATAARDTAPAMDGGDAAARDQAARRTFALALASPEAQLF
jgi:uncharacterized protein (DUF1800 family)